MCDILKLDQLAAEVVCEELQKDLCAFSIASSGKRCLLETAEVADGGMEYQCRTSEVVVERMVEYIETDQCVKACGVEREFVGISSDALLEPQFTAKLCSPPCYKKCPNIVDLYFNLAAGEGMSFSLLLFHTKCLIHLAPKLLCMSWLTGESMFGYLIESGI